MTTIGYARDLSKSCPVCKKKFKADGRLFTHAVTGVSCHRGCRKLTMAKQRGITPVSHGNCAVYTPDDVANEIIIKYGYKLAGKTVLEPTAGSGAFLRALRDHSQAKRISWCEISKGINFYHTVEQYDWIVCCPPFDDITDIFAKCAEIAREGMIIICDNRMKEGSEKRVRALYDGTGFNHVFRELRVRPKTWPEAGTGCVVAVITKRDESEATIRLNLPPNKRLRHGANWEPADASKPQPSDDLSWI